jgi:hypothetical protein
VLSYTSALSKNLYLCTVYNTTLGAVNWFPSFHILRHSSQWVVALLCLCPDWCSQECNKLGDRILCNYLQRYNPIHKTHAENISTFQKFLLSYEQVKTPLKIQAFNVIFCCLTEYQTLWTGTIIVATIADGEVLDDTLSVVLPWVRTPAVWWTGANILKGRTTS